MREIETRKIVLENMLAVNRGLAAGWDAVRAPGGGWINLEPFAAFGGYSEFHLDQARAVIAKLEKEANNVQ